MFCVYLTFLFSQVMKIIQNVRPNRQTVLFSATFPPHMDGLARRILNDPLIITVGSRSTVSSTITQIVLVLTEDEKFLKLLEVLGQAQTDDDQTKVLIFTDTQDSADRILSYLIRRGYPSQALHGGMDQMDRDSTIADFKSGATNVLIATSVAARGLDVKNLNVVINYECPNHMEDYVHRVGRTGRAGKEGTAYTFVTLEQERYSIDVIRALKRSGVAIPPELDALGKSFRAKIKAGTVKYIKGNGYGGKGLARLDRNRDAARTVLRITHGDETVVGQDTDTLAIEDVKKQAAIRDESGLMLIEGPSGVKASAKKKFDPAEMARMAESKKKVTEIASRLSQHINSGVTVGKNEEGHAIRKYAFEFEINEFASSIRYRLMSYDTRNTIYELTRARLSVKGLYVLPGKECRLPDKKLYLVCVVGWSNLLVCGGRESTCAGSG
jgi:ATP-dependent RNA helicase DDX46/PRP5